MDHNHRAVEGLMAIPGIDLSLRNRSGFPPLHHAVMKGNARALELMVAKDKSEIHTVANGVTPLRLAVNNDQDECVRVLILMGGCDVNRPFASSSCVPLLLACVRAVYRAAEALLELDADVNAQDLGGQTALHTTISGRRIEDRHGPQSEQEKQVRVALACLLISNGAYVDVEDFGGRDPLSHGDPDVIEGVKSFMTKNPELVRRKSERASSNTGAASSITGCSDMDIGQRFNQLSMSTKREPFMSASSSIDPANTGDQLSISTVRKGIKSALSTADPGKGEDQISTSTKRDSIMFDQAKSGVKLKEALKGVGLPCGLCGAPKADVTLLPCQHKCVCSTCSIKVTECLLCEEVVQDKIVTGADGQSVHPNDCKQM
ncbi:hypothetical protein V1264_007113 [Littorina saxatilis]|uniref:E3 ubiquitin-protein ligase MIB2 n=2 Tax=Littorina saxatilis TaxID=31220 RepID=A0AAN9AVK2_9CAEN